MCIVTLLAILLSGKFIQIIWFGLTYIVTFIKKLCLNCSTKVMNLNGVFYDSNNVHNVREVYL